MEVTLEQMLAAREERTMHQFALLRQFSLPIISFSMNIPGPIKDSAVIRRGFYEGCKTLEYRLPEKAVKYRQIRNAVTGSEAIYAVDMPPMEIKKITTEIEDFHGLGRLFDMDVIDSAMGKLDRKCVNGNSRNCIVCGAPRSHGCASRRLHSLRQLQEATEKILSDYFAKTDVEQIGSLAVQSLLDEVYTTPKPGLVDRNNTGSHWDMDIHTFMTSAAALGPYFCRCAEIGLQTREDAAETTFFRLRQEGLLAEQKMFAVTDGVNTHKGAIFTMGLLCGAAGRLWHPEGGYDVQRILQEVSAMSAEAMQADLRCRDEKTVGLQLYRQEGIQGIRGEAAMGFPSLKNIGLPVYEKCIRDGMDSNRAGCVTLLHLIASVQDTNMIARGGLKGAREAAQRVRGLLDQLSFPAVTEIEALDRWFIERNLSPGGCADLLAAVYFLTELEKTAGVKI